jgi:hypothetical protein
MKKEKLIAELEQSTLMIRDLTRGFSEDEARITPTPEAWSVLEVVCHLLDEEREDFRQHLDIILHHAKDPWSPIDPAGWVTARKYNEQIFSEIIDKFFTEREISLTWLRTLDQPKWEQEMPTPWGKTIRAGDVFASWVAHDNLHIRQIVELRRSRIEKITIPYEINYAGDW